MKLQARSMARYLDPTLVGDILVVFNDPYKKWVADYFNCQILPEYGPIQGKVRFIDSEDARLGAPKRFGWQSQQVLKLTIARAVTSDSYLILDAKNHFIRWASADAFFAADGRLRSHLNPMAPKFMKNLSAACAFFGVEVPSGGRLMPTTTPFLADTALVVAMLEEIEGKSGLPFGDFFIRAKGLYTEFTLYSAYHLLVRGAFDATYEERSGPTATLFRGARSRPDRAAAVFDRLQRDEGIYCMGVHRSVLLQGDHQIIPAVQAVWQRFGLVESAAEATYFCDFEPIPLKERIRRFFVWMAG